MRIFSILLPTGVGSLFMISASSPESPLRSRERVLNNHAEQGTTEFPTEQGTRNYEERERSYLEVSFGAAVNSVLLGSISSGLNPPGDSPGGSSPEEMLFTTSSREDGGLVHAEQHRSGGRGTPQADTDSFGIKPRSEEYVSDPQNSFRSSFVGVTRVDVAKEAGVDKAGPSSEGGAPNVGTPPAPIVDALMLAITALLKSGGRQLHVGQQVFKKTQCPPEGDKSADGGDKANSETHGDKGICSGAELLEIAEIVGDQKAKVKSASSEENRESAAVETTPKTGRSSPGDVVDIATLAPAAIPFSKRPVMGMASAVAQAVLEVFKVP